MTHPRIAPELSPKRLLAWVADHFHIEAASLSFLPVGNDVDAALYRLDAGEGRSYVLKVWFAGGFETGLSIPNALIARGVPHILAPLPNGHGDVWAPLAGEDGIVVALFPFIAGETAKRAGMSLSQWQTFGTTLKAVHDCGPDIRESVALPTESFALPGAESVRTLLGNLALLQQGEPPARFFAEVLGTHHARIREILHRAEALGAEVGKMRLPSVLCHGDIHGANILIETNEDLWVIDWDGPLLAPRERDLLFIVGSRIGRPVTPAEEASFFSGYGRVDIEPAALAYFRYERRIDDLAEIGRRVLSPSSLDAATQVEHIRAAAGWFAPGGDFTVAEVVGPH